MQALYNLLYNDPMLRMNLTQAIYEAQGQGYDLGYASMLDLCVLMNNTISQAPPFDETALVGCPINALLDPLMNMPSGYALFRSASLNQALKAVLVEWCNFLLSPGSTTYLNEQSPTGWFCPAALAEIDMTQFVCDPSQPFWGFTSWNDYFTRHFVAGARPIADPGNNQVIVSACEASPFNTQSNLQVADSFWMKSQPYSLQDIFASGQSPLVSYFAGGDLYQAFLSADNYHRWHAPVSGTITDAYNVDGTYYSDTEFAGYDPAGPNFSQGYITAVATRAIIVIDTGDPTIGSVACVFVGMAEISSNMIEVTVGQQVNKGDEIGYFQYGGSTFCLIFQPGAINQFLPQPPFNLNAPPIKLGVQIALAN